MNNTTVVLKIVNIKDLDKGLVEINEEDILNNFSIKRLIVRKIKNKMKRKL